MRILDLSRPHGTVHPPQPVEGSDRLLAYEQDGALFDAQGREIVSGETPESTTAPQTPVAVAQQRRLVEQLLAKADSASRHEIQRTGTLVLGDGCPTKRNDILETLRAKLALWRAQGGAGLIAGNAGFGRRLTGRMMRGARLWHGERPADAMKPRTAHAHRSRER